MGEKGNWAGTPGRADVPAGLDTGRQVFPADAKGVPQPTDGKGLLSETNAKGPGSAPDAKGLVGDTKGLVGDAEGFGGDADGKGLVGDADAKGFGGDDVRSRGGLPPVGGVFRRRDPEDGPDSSGPRL